MLRQSFFQPLRRVAVATALMLSVTSGAMAIPVLPGQATPSAMTLVRDRDDVQARHYRRYGHQRGYRVNRYGYGSYVRGPNGGFGGYPAGSAGATILRQQQHDKCEAVPESC